MYKLKISLVFAALFLIGVAVFVSCGKDTITQEIENPVQLDNKEYGSFHNEILSQFYAKKHTKKTLSFDEKIELIDSYLATVVDSINPGDFTQIVNNQLSQKDYLLQISTTQSDIQTGYDIINSMSNSNQISDAEFNYFNSIIRAYEDYPFQFDALYAKIVEIEEQIANDNSISDTEKYNLISVIIITKSSIQYWSGEENLKKVSKKNSIPWYARDAVGAMTGVQTGLVGYATMLAGPWGGAAALIGSAALSSSI